MERALGDVSGSPRLAFICHVVLGSLALDRGDVEAGARHATAANAINVVDDLRSAGHALASRAALARGDLAAALAHGLESTRIAAGCTDLELTFGTPSLALAEAHVARGEREAARDVLTPIATAIASMASTIANEDQRRGFLERPLANDRIGVLARELGITSG